jgi:hypothetical protein
MTQSNTDRAEILIAAFDATKITFKDRAATLEAITNDREISYDEAGNPSVFYDGQTLPLADALTRYAFDATDSVCDRRTLPREGAGGGRKGTLSKADLPDYKSRAAFIAENGLSAYERLPLRPPASGELKYREDYFALPRGEKVRLTNLHGADFATTLPRRPTGQPLGSFINAAALERQKQIRPGSKH